MTRLLTIERNDDEGGFLLLDDGIGMCRSKSRNVLVRIRDALNAVAKSSLDGATVYRTIQAGNPIRGVVVAVAVPSLVVRLDDDKLDLWPVTDCRVAEPARPEPETTWKDPAVGVVPAIALLNRWLKIDSNSPPSELTRVASDTVAFLNARLTVFAAY